MPNHRPKLRPVQPQPAQVRGQPVLVLQDPLQLAERVLLFPAQLAPVLGFLDGTRDLDEVRASLMIRAGIRLSTLELQQVVAQLDDALLLENDRALSAMDAIVEQYRAAPHRSPSLAGHGYPAAPEELRDMLDSYLQRLPPGPADSDEPVRGLVSPHIDYQRGGPVYAQVWSRVADAVRQAELVVVLGTDHLGAAGGVTLTRQSYATPYGVLPTDLEIVDAVAAAVGQERAFAHEIHHRQEHSIELAVTWLHHMRRGQPCALVPVLAGSFHQFVEDEASAGPSADSTFRRALEALGASLQGRPALVVAAADLAHIGPAFEGRPVDLFGRAQLRAQDQELMAAMGAGDAERFYAILRAEGNRRNVCGLPPIYLALRLLQGVNGEITGYDCCPADQAGTSFVSICGMVWRDGAAG